MIATTEHARSQPHDRRQLWSLTALTLVLVLLVYLNPSTLPFAGQLVFSGIQVALAAAWAVWKIHRGRGLAATAINIPLALLLAVAALSTLLSPSPRPGLAVLTDWLRLTWLFYLLADLLAGGWSPDLVVNSMLLVGTVVLADALWSTVQWLWERWNVWAMGYPLLPLPFRIFGPAGHPNQLVAVIYLLLPFGIVRLWQNRSAGARALWATWLLAADLVIFFTSSRGGWGGAMVVVLLCVGLLLVHNGMPTVRDLPRWVARQWRVLLTTAAYLLLFVLLFAAQATQLSTSRGGLVGDSGREQFWGQALVLFFERPLLGAGPGSYAWHYVANASGTYNFVAVYAHNWLLNLLAQLGAAGALAFVWLVAAGAWAWMRQVHRLRRAPSPADERRQLLLYACCAAWSGLLVHSLVEAPFQTVTLFALCIAALGLHLSGALVRSERRGAGRLQRYPVAARLTCLFIVLLLGGLWWTGVPPALADAEYRTAQAAATRGDWAAAAAATNAATRSDPQLGFYNGQRAYALAMLAQGGRGLAPALAAYASDARAEPGYVASQLNTAALLLEVGDAAQARALLEQMTRRDPAWPLPHLLLARAFEQAGDGVSAREQFATLLHIDAAYAHTVGCAGSTICSALTPAAPNEDDALTVALAALATGDPQPLQTLALGTDIPERWVPLADFHLRRGELAQARYALVTASEPLRFAQPGMRERYGLTLARYNQLSNRPAQALAALQYVAAPPFDTLSYIFVYGKSTLADPLLPQVARLLDTPDRLEVYREIARLAQAQGSSAVAADATRQADALAAQLHVP